MAGWIRTVAAAVLLTVAGAGLVSAQETTGTITGKGFG